MATRKSFIKQSLLGLGATLLPKILHASATSNSQALLQNQTDFAINDKLIFLNNGTLGPSPKQVIDAMKDGLEDVTMRGLYNRRKYEAVDNLASFVGADSSELMLTHNVTEGVNIMAWGLQLKAGDEVILCNQEHVGNAAPWLHRAKIDKLIIKKINLGNSQAETLDNIKKVITAKTKVLALPHIPCTNGQVLPIKEIAAFAKSKKIITCIDGAHPTGMMPLNITELGVDAYASCCHKWLLAAQGTGYVYINKNSHHLFTPKFLGAEGILEFNTVADKPFLKEKTEPIASRFNFGTQSGMLASSITAAVQYQLGLGKENIYKHISELNDYLYNQLAEDKKLLTLKTPKEKKSRSGILAFQFTDKNNKVFVEKMLEKGIVIRYIAENKLDWIRVSTHIYNTKEQVDTLLAEIRK
jgi:cysteine desulfurase / selenocysteine lyase